MSNASEQDTILAELGSTNNGRFIPFAEAAIDELTAILDAYTGDLPTSNARARFHRENRDLDVSASKAEERPLSFQEVWLPVPYAQASGEATWVVSTAELLRLRAADLSDGEVDLKARLLCLADHYAAMAESAPAVRPYSERVEEMERNEAAVAEMLDIVLASPDLARAHGIAELDWLIHHYRDVRSGRYYYRHLGWIDYPESMQSPALTQGMVFSVGLAMHLIASHREAADPNRAALLHYLANTFYFEGDLEVAVDLPSGDSFSFCDLDHMNVEDAQRLIEKTSAEPLPGSLGVFPYTDQWSRYSADSGEFEFRPYRYWLYEDHDDRTEMGLLVGKTRAYSASVGRD